MNDVLFQIGVPAGGGSWLYEVISEWQSLGIYDVVLPFLLVFTLTFAVLEKAKIFGAEKKNINVIVSLIIALLFLQNNYLVFVLGRFLPNIGISLIVFLMFLLLFSIFGGEDKPWSDGALTLGFIISIIAVIMALSTDVLPFGNYGLLDFWYNLSPGLKGLLIFGIAIFLIIGYVTREKKPGTGLGKWLGDLTKGMKS